MLTRRLPEPWASIVATVAVLVAIGLLLTLVGGGLGPIEAVLVLLLIAAVVALGVRSALAGRRARRSAAPPP